MFNGLHGTYVRKEKNSEREFIIITCKDNFKIFNQV